MVGIGKAKRRVLSATGHRQRAERYRCLATQNFDPRVIQELVRSAIRHEAFADELEKQAHLPGEGQSIPLRPLSIDLRD